MLHFFAILFLSCSVCFGASTFFYCPTTNDLISIEITPNNTRLVALLSGLDTTNSNAKFFIYNTNSTAAVDWNNVFKPANQNGRWLAVNIFDVATGYRINGAATAGEFLRADGSTFRQGLIEDADLGSGSSIGTKFLRGDRTWQPAAGSGTVTSVALTAPSFIIVAGSPITTSGTLALTFANQDPGEFLVGPIAGNPAAAPTFRGMDVGDIPLASSFTWTGPQVIKDNYLGSSALTIWDDDLSTLWFGDDANQAIGGIIYAHSSDQMDLKVNNASRITISSDGTVVIPQLTASRYVKADSGKALSTVVTETANTVFAGPTSGGAAVPAFRALVAADVGTIVPTSTAAQVIGSSTDYTFSSSGVMEEVDFGAGDPTLSLPAAGTYYLYATVTSNVIIGSTTTFDSQFKDTTTGPTFLGVPVASNFGAAAVNTTVTVSGATTVKLFSSCSSTTGTPKILSVRTLVGYVKMSN